MIDNPSGQDSSAQGSSGQGSSGRGSSGFASGLRTKNTALAALAATAIILVSVHQHYPLQHWLLLRYLAYWLSSLLFAGACTAVGFAILRAIVPAIPSLIETLALSIALGLLAYFCLAFLVGLLGGFGAVFFYLVPFALLAAGAKTSFHFGKRLLRHFCHARNKAARQPLPFRAYPVIVLGVIGLGLMYFSILSPENAAYDARWYHLPLAQQYAHEGKLFRFPEGWVMGTYPQLGSIVYAWAFMGPGRLFDHVALSAHLEFVFFLFRLAAIPALVRAVLPRQVRRRTRAGLSWVAVFLFPGILLYDSNLNLSADHWAAFWAIPAYLAAMRAYRSFDAGWCTITAALMAGAFLTKYTAVIFVAPLVFALLGRALWLLLQRTDQASVRRVLRGLGILTFTGLVMTAPHWLKNLVWYGDPIYPQLHGWLDLRPWVPEAVIPYHFDIAVPWHPSRDLQGLLETLEVTFTFAFVHHDWPDLHGRAPVFGFLFTVTLLLLPFLGKAKRLWALYGAGHLGVALWCTISWQDRYLQALVPWMCAAVAASIILSWRLGLIARLATGILLVTQVAWGADVYFFTTHRIIRSPALKSIELLNQGRQGKYEKRLQVFPALARVGQKLPPDAVVLIHESRQSFGLARRRVHDRPGTQGRIYYSRYRTPRELWLELEDMDITHVVWTRPEGTQTVAAELIFRDFVRNYTVDRQKAGRVRAAKLVEDSPPIHHQFSPWTLVHTCKGGYPAGLHRTERLDVSPFDPAPVFPKPAKPLTRRNQRELLGKAGYLVVDPQCPSRTRLRKNGFKGIGTIHGVRLYRRKDDSFFRTEPSNH